MDHDPWPWEGLADHVGQVPAEHVGLIATAERALLAAGAQRVAEAPWGLLLRSQFTPDVYEANLAVVTSADVDPDAVLDAVELAAAEDGLNHRSVRVDVAEQVDPFAAATARRWPEEPTRSTQAVMMGVAAPDRRVETAGVETLLVGDLDDFMARVRAADGHQPIVVRQMATRDKRLGMALGDPSALAVGLRDATGDLVAGAQVLVMGPIAMVEEVNVLAEARGQGHGRRIAQAALDLAADAGARSVFLTAGTDDWPWRLYARMGLVTALVQTSFIVSGPPAMGGTSTPDR